MSSVKAVMQDRISKTEELRQLRSWQEQLIGKQGEFQAGMHEEFARLKSTIEGVMMKSVGEPESVGSKSTLSIVAPIFVLTAATSAESGSEKGGSRMMQCPAPYDGSSAWEAYRTQFGLLAALNKWNDQEKAAYLAISLF